MVTWDNVAKQTCHGGDIPLWAASLLATWPLSRKSVDKLSKLYLHLHITYEHQTRQVGELSWEVLLKSPGLLTTWPSWGHAKTWHVAGFREEDYHSLFLPSSIGEGFFPKNVFHGSTNLSGKFIGSCSTRVRSCQGERGREGRGASQMHFPVIWTLNIKFFSTMLG